MFETGIVTQFEATHRLKGNFGPATQPHGHSYRVEVTLRGPDLRPDGTLCDITVLQEAAERAVGELRGRDLGEVPELQTQNTTAEVVARYLFRRIEQGIGPGSAAALAVRVWESPEAFGGFEGDLA